MPSNIIGYLHGHNSSACLVKDGASSPSSRRCVFLGQKHAVRIFPIRAIEGCLKLGGIAIADVDCFAFGYDAPSFAGGEIAAIYDRSTRPIRLNPGPGLAGDQPRKHSVEGLPAV